MRCGRSMSSDRTTRKCDCPRRPKARPARAPGSLCWGASGRRRSIERPSQVEVFMQVASQFRQLLEDEWEFVIQDDPLYATQCGDHRYDDRLPLVSEADYSRRLDRMRAFRDRLRAIDRDALDRKERLNYDIFGLVLDNEIGELEFRAYRLPIAKVGGFHSSFADLPEYAPLETQKDYENYIARLTAYKAYG